jgi:hypothetical protein
MSISVHVIRQKREFLLVNLKLPAAMMKDSTEELGWEGRVEVGC